MCFPLFLTIKTMYGSCGSNKSNCGGNLGSCGSCGSINACLIFAVVMVTQNT